MASPGNRHCANCIGTLSFPLAKNIKTSKQQYVYYRVSQKSEPLNILQQQPQMCSDLNKILHTQTTSVTNITT